MNDYYDELLLDGYDQIKLIGIGKDQHMSSISNWTSGNVGSVVSDSSSDGNPVWNQWDATQRELFILDHEGVVVFAENITSWSNGVPTDVKNLIIDLINEIPLDELLGDINGDDLLNILDIVSLVTLVLNGVDNPVADMNEDGLLNILDIVTLVTLVLNT